MPSSSRCCRSNSKNWNRIAQSSSVLQGLGNLDLTCTNPSVHVRVVHAFVPNIYVIINLSLVPSNPFPSPAPSCLFSHLLQLPLVCPTCQSLGLCRYSRFRTAHCSRLLIVVNLSILRKASTHSNPSPSIELLLSHDRSLWFGGPMKPQCLILGMHSRYSKGSSTHVVPGCIWSSIRHKALRARHEEQS